LHVKSNNATTVESTTWQMLVRFVNHAADGSVLKFLERHMIKRYHENRKVMFPNANTEL